MGLPVLIISIYKEKLNDITVVQDDLAAQLRIVKKRLQEAEEEQYKVYSSYLNRHSF
jgi:hypothetical protein